MNSRYCINTENEIEPGFGSFLFTQETDTMEYLFESDGPSDIDDES